MHKLRRAGILVTFFVLTLALLAPGLAADNQTASALDHLISTYSNYGLFNGAVLVAQNGKVIFKKGYGLANMEWNIPNTTDTKFRLGSITKQFTAMLVLQQVQRGKLRLDGHISDYLPYYRKDTGSKVTLHQLLSHTSGIPNYSGVDAKFMRQYSRDFYTPQVLVTKFCSGDLEFEPGTKFNYDNSGYAILGAILEQVSGKPYADLLQEDILGPLGMKNSGYDHFETILSKRATGYSRALAGLENSAYVDMSLPYAAGSLYSTVEDLYLWDQALYGDQLLRADLKALLFKPNLQNYGYGWFVETLAGNEPGAPGTIVTHDGVINGFSTMIVRLIKDHNLIVLLDNTRSGKPNLDHMSLNIRRILYGQELKPIYRSLAETLGKTIATQGMEAAIAQYRELKRSRSSEYFFNEVELNRLATTLLSLDRRKDAIEIYKLNVSEYPQSPGAYNVLAGAYLNDGQKQLAIETYNKVLAIDPQNRNAQRMLQTLTTVPSKDPAK